MYILILYCHNIKIFILYCYNMRKSISYGELEDGRNFTLGITEAIEAWAADALHKSENTPEKESEWEYRACIILKSACQDVPKSVATGRAKKAVELDLENYDARFAVAIDDDLDHMEAVKLLSELRDDILNHGNNNTVILGRTLMGLGNRLWDMDEDYELASKTHLEYIAHGHVGPTFRTHIAMAMGISGSIAINRSMRNPRLTGSDLEIQSSPIQQDHCFPWERFRSKKP
ncbi:hypothetical protein EDB80DRAFT_783826 [Ilyonectria destructans]|nr:hypothetical protein EDB80DRAFT_783826 [Ilyonectria destructans]